MTSALPSGIHCRILLLVLLLLAGCAGKHPRTVPLDGDEQARILAGFSAFAQRDCPLSLDADITLEMRLLGKTEKSAGILQYQGPSSFRYAMVDPLGRSMFIMATDGYTFTMVYNRDAKAVTGSTASRFWHDYVPSGVSAADMLLLLAGRSPENLRLMEVFGNQEGSGFWLYGVGAEGIRHEILFEHESSLVRRHIIKNGDDAVLFDVVYNEFSEDDPFCPRPRVMQVEGKNITGTILLRVDQVYSGQPIPAQNFRVIPPPHFLVQEVD